MENEPRLLTLYVTDTHGLFWYLTASPRLGSQAKSAFDASARGEAVIYIPAIVLAELFFLNEKAGQPLNFSQEFKSLRDSGQFAFMSFDVEDVPDFETDKAVSEMHDRMIAGVARRLDAVLITIDSEIVKSGVVKTIW